MYAGLIARQVVLLTRLSKLCCAIRPPCRAKELLHAEASSCLDTDFLPDIRRLQQSEVLLRHKVVQLRHKSNFLYTWTAFQTKIQVAPA